MKKKSSVRKRSIHCKLIRRKGRLYCINKKKILSSIVGKVNICIMARISGVDIPKNKRGEIALTYVYGIGRSRSKQILSKVGLDNNKKVEEWTDDEYKKIIKIISDEYKVEGELRSEVIRSTKRLIDISSYRGIRHRVGMPVRGQRTKNNTRTKKGKKKTVANKKKATK